MQWDICECRPLATPVPPYRANGAGHHRFAAVTLRSWQIVAARGLAPLAVCLRRVNGPSGLSGDLRMSGVPRLGRHRCSPYGLRSRKPESRNRLPGSGPPLPVRTVRERSGPGRMQVRESVPGNRMPAERPVPPRARLGRGRAQRRCRQIGSCSYITRPVRAA